MGRTERTTGTSLWSGSGPGAGVPRAARPPVGAARRWRTGGRAARGTPGLHRLAAALVVLAALAGPARAGVVVNEILYHAPNDRDDLQFVELHNTGDRPVDLGGWKFTRGVRYEFP